MFAAVIARPGFQEAALALGGYDLSESGAIRRVS